MNKSLQILLIVFGVILLLYVIGRITKTIQVYSIPTTSNYPTIRNGSFVVATNLVKPERFDFICYNATTPVYGEQIFVHRLCGIENDVLEIKNGDLYVNDKPVDNNFSLAHIYQVTYPEFDKLEEIEEVDENFITQESKDSVTLCISDKIVKSGVVRAKRIDYPADLKNDQIQMIFSKPWNQDHFGPVKIPKGKYFVLGDNREFSQDSRYLGFIDESDYVGTVIRKK